MSVEVVEVVEVVVVAAGRAWQQQQRQQQQDGRRSTSGTGSSSSTGSTSGALSTYLSRSYARHVPSRDALSTTRLLLLKHTPVTGAVCSAKVA